MTSSEPVTSLELERSVFDSAETRILSTAFERAWAYVEFDPMLGILDAAERQSELALLRRGQQSPVRAPRKNGA